MLLKKTILAAALGLAAIAGTAASASAETYWRDHHPRRVEVNHRLANQDWRIDRERREGETAGARRPTCIVRVTSSATRRGSMRATMEVI
jgi:hypothetical protein